MSLTQSRERGHYWVRTHFGKLDVASFDGEHWTLPGVDHYFTEGDEFRVEGRIQEPIPASSGVTVARIREKLPEAEVYELDPDKRYLILYAMEKATPAAMEWVTR